MPSMSRRRARQAVRRDRQPLCVSLPVPLSLSEGAVTDLNDPEIVEIFRWIFEDDPQQEAVERRLDRLLAPGPEETHLDPRIQKIVELIRNEPDRNYSQGELAASLGLSPSRLLHLFSEQLGVPYRRFRMWKRLMLSFELLHEQDNMTLAALDFGLRRRHPFQPCVPRYLRRQSRAGVPQDRALRPLGLTPTICGDRI